MIPRVSAQTVFSNVNPDVVPKITVVTPAYNARADLEVAVASLNAQTLVEFEWILVDDGSDDQHQPMIEAAVEAARFATTVIRHIQNAQQGQARNTGLHHARAPYIKFLDADDALDPEHLEVLLAKAETLGKTREIAFACTRHVFLGSDKHHDNNSYQTLSDDADAQLARMIAAPFLSHCGALFPRDLLFALGGYDPTLSTDEDGDLLLRVLFAGWRFQPAFGVYYLYRHRKDEPRVSVDDDPAKVTARLRVGAQVFHHFRKQGQEPPPRVRAALCKRFDALAVRSSPHQRDHARCFLTAARDIDAAYVWSGSRFERAIRRLAGINTAGRIMTALRQLRGVSSQ